LYRVFLWLLVTIWVEWVCVLCIFVITCGIWSGLGLCIVYFWDKWYFMSVEFVYRLSWMGLCNVYFCDNLWYLFFLFDWVCVPSYLFIISLRDNGPWQRYQQSFIFTKQCFCIYKSRRDLWAKQPSLDEIKLIRYLCRGPLSANDIIELITNY
jgi:hypothetical protein